MFGCKVESNEIEFGKLGYAVRKDELGFCEGSTRGEAEVTREKSL